MWEKIIPGHLVGFGSVADMWECDDYDFTDAGMSEVWESDMPSKKECDRMCEELSGEVVIWKRKKAS